MTVSTTEYALLARQSYQDATPGQAVNADGARYVVIDHADDPRTGFQATAYQRSDTHDIVIAFRGSEFGRELLQDGGTDAGMVLTGLNAQAPDALAFTQRVAERAKLDAELNHRPVDVTVTGHSLGGTLAEIAAAKCHLKGETFNAYGAAGLLYGLPAGGHQVIDHVRAGDLVSAASAHFGEVRIYATQQDIDTLSKAGYRDDSGPFSLRNPIEATDFAAHGIDNFVPDNKIVGHSIVGAESEALYQQHKGMIDRYRNDIREARTVLSAPWELPRAVVHGVEEVGHTVAEKVSEGAHAIGHAVEDAVEGVEHAAEAVGERVSHAFHTLTHPDEWFDRQAHSAHTRLDQPDHPDHALFQQARAAVHALDAERHRTPDQQSDQLAAAMVVAARRAGLDHIDGAVLNEDGSRAYAVQGDVKSPFRRIAEIRTEEAVRTSVERSSSDWGQATEQSRQSQTALPQTHPTIDQPGPAPPALFPAV